MSKEDVGPFGASSEGDDVAIFIQYMGIKFGTSLNMGVKFGTSINMGVKFATSLNMGIKFATLLNIGAV